MSKYKSSASSASSSSSNQPIWTTLTTPSQIARKYASIAPIWCHISRPRQLKKKFASTFHQAQNLLSRTHSKENSVNSKSNELDDDTDELTSTNTYKNSLTAAELGSSSNYSFKKRDSSLDYKSSRKNEVKSDQFVPSSSSYVSSYTTNPVSNARWTSKPLSTYKESYDNSSLLEDNQAPSSEIPAARRPNKYVSSKYGQQGATGSKTERIISKSSKSSPNLVSKDKDYESFYTDRYEPKWTNNSYNNYVNHGHSQYHSNPSYTNYGYNSYSNYSNNDSYNHYNSNREDKWNELDSMLGAQSALLSRLESDFVANRNKLKTNSNLNTIGSSSTINSTGSQYKTPSYSSKYSGTSANLSSKSHNNMSSISNENETTSSYVPSRYRTPTKKTSGSTTSKYTAKLDDIELESQKKAVRKPASFISTAKTEPLIDLIKSLDIGEEKKSDDTEDKLLGIEKTLDESINKVLSESMAENFANLAGLAASTSVTGLGNNQSPSVPNTPNQVNNHDFVDDFINDYINSTLLKSDTNTDISSSANNGVNNAVNNSVNNLVNNAISVCNGGGIAKANENSAVIENNGSMNSLNLKNEATDNLGSLVSVHETPSWFVSAWRIIFSSA